MCLLITQSATAPILSDAWLEDFHAYNSDGAGIMYVENGKLHVHKIVPKDSSDFIKLYREHAEGRNCAIHLRYKTHGAIDHENTHPYEVFGEDHPDGALWMMHNGVLSTGNDADTTKSDTWHFIREYLRPMLEKNRDLLHTPQFQAMLGSFIGNNRFTFMDELGRVVTINEQQGIYWGGRWMSNTYAWTAPRYSLTTDGGYTEQEIAQLEVDELPQRSSLLVAGDPRKTTKGWASRGYGYDYDYDYEYDYYDSPSSTKTAYSTVYSDDVEYEWSAKDIAEDALEWLVEAGFSVTVTVEDVCAYITKLGDDALYDLCYALRDGHLLEADFNSFITDLCPLDADYDSEEYYEEFAA